MNSTHSATVDFNRWLTKVTSGSLPPTLNIDGSQRPFEVHFGSSALGLINLPPLMGSLQTLPDLVRQSLVAVSRKLAQEEGRQLQCDLITVRIFTPDTQLIDYDCLLGRYKSGQTVWYTHSGALSFGCMGDAVANTNAVSNNDSASNPPRSLSSLAASLFQRFVASRLSPDHFKHTFENILTGYPLCRSAQLVRTAKYMVCSLFEPRRQNHMFHIRPMRYENESPGEKPLCIQIIFRQLEYRRTSDLFKRGALVQDNNGTSQWTI